MILLKDILRAIETKKIYGDATIEVSSMCIDSRQVVAGSVFVAVKGNTVDGHEYIGKACALGAIAIVCEQMPAELVAGVVYVLVVNSAQAAGQLADAYYGSPSAEMKVVGVTGTNGKTTTATLLYKLFGGLGYKCGLLSTVVNYIGNDAVPATHTTPDAISVHGFLRRMADAGCSYVFMEVSSHAVHQHRVAGVRFAGGVFTNITHDHLDYHKTFDEYIRVKKAFFDGLPKGAFALTNADDKRGMVMLQNTVADRKTYSLKVPADVKGKVLENNLTGLVMLVDGKETHFRMIGTFNASNLLAVYGAATLLGEDGVQVLSVLSGLHGVPGRFETFMSAKDKVLAIVDYAHTPDALINVLATINQLRTGGQQLISVVGCGGDRDRTKRPIMGQVACEHSDKAILTSDNPRSEDPEAILSEMEAELTGAQRRKCLRITDRKEAIKVACTLANAGDIILIAGKGHETYQEIKGIKYHFDDRETINELFELLNR